MHSHRPTDILITGGNGLLASYIEGTRLTKDELDITNEHSLMEVFHKLRPRTVVHTAAIVDLGYCEREPAQACLVNTLGAYYTALAARAVGAKMVYISTSAVFDGSKTTPYDIADQVAPLSVYGHSKLLGEQAVLGICPDALVVRTSWLFGGGPKRDTKFVGTVLQRMQKRETVRAVVDRTGSPTYAKDLAQAISRLVEDNVSGVVHIGGTPATRFEVAAKLAELVNAPTPLSAQSNDFISTYKNGINESIQSSVELRPWQEALAEYLYDEWGITKTILTEF
jgi:dTDP-4-dehydrorhamnose reductase